MGNGPSFIVKHARAADDAVNVEVICPHCSKIQYDMIVRGIDVGRCCMHCMSSATIRAKDVEHAINDLLEQDKPMNMSVLRDGLIPEE